MNLKHGNARTGRTSPEYTVWLAIRPHVLGAIVSAAKVVASQGKTPTRKTIARNAGVNG